MATRGQRFELDLDANNWKFDIHENDEDPTPVDVVKEIKERDASSIPAAPSMKTSKTGFPEHRPRKFPSAFKQQQQKGQDVSTASIQHPGPSDRAILHHLAKKQGIDLSMAKQKADIDAENRQKINNMSLEDIEEARAELMAQINPDALKKFLQRANLDDEHKQQEKEWGEHEAGRVHDPSRKSVTFTEPDEQQQESQDVGESQSAEAASRHMNSVQEQQQAYPSTLPSTYPQPNPSNIHFPTPPRQKSDYKPLDPTSATFLSDLREHYFPDLPHDPNALSWLSDPTPEEDSTSPYNPTRAGFAPSALRFNFNGTLIPPSESISIPITKGLHHHGDAPSSAGYTIPELTLLARSTLPNQRCIAYQVMGRILFRLGRGDFGPRGSDLNEGLWNCIERERIVEVMMAEANRDKGHLSSKAFATEALWLWRRGGAGDRGVLREGERRAA